VDIALHRNPPAKPTNKPTKGTIKILFILFY